MFIPKKYTQLHLIYGIPLYSGENMTTSLSFPLARQVEQGPGFPGLLTYQANRRNQKSAAFGVHMRAISGFAHHSNLTPDITTVRPEHRRAFDALWSALPPAFRDEIQALGPPRRFLLVATHDNAPDSLLRRLSGAEAGDDRSR